MNSTGSSQNLCGLTVGGDTPGKIGREVHLPVRPAASLTSRCQVRLCKSAPEQTTARLPFASAHGAGFTQGPGIVVAAGTHGPFSEWLR